MKLMILFSQIKPCGPYRVLSEMINGLIDSKKDVSITIVTLFDGNDTVLVRNLKEKQVTVVSLGLTKKNYFLHQKKRLKSVIKSGTPDVIHSHGLFADISLASTKTGAKKISTLHSNIYEDYKNRFGYFLSPLIIFIHLRAMRKIDVVVGCSQTVKDCLPQKWNHTTFIQNGIDPLEFKRDTESRKRLREDYKINILDRIYIYSGNLSVGKRVPLLVSNFIKSRRENEYLFLLGEGEARIKIEEMKDDHVILLGFRKNVRDYLSMADIYVSASATEGLSISALEALASGLYLCLSDIPSHREIIATDMNCGVLWNDDFETKKEKVLQLLENGYPVKEVFEHHFKNQIMANSYYKIYRSKGESL